MALCTLGVTSCNNDDTVAVNQIVLTPPSASVVEGSTITLKAKVLPTDATDPMVKWNSNNTAIASVDQKGVVTGVKADSAVITAMAGGVKATAAITVVSSEVPVEGIGLSKDTITLAPGSTEQLVAAYSPINATNVGDFMWSSDNKAIATVSDNGLVSAISAGETKITVTLDKFTASCVVIISTKPVGELTLPLLKNVTGKDIEVHATGLLAGDKIKLEDLFGYSATVDLTGVTATGGSFTMPDAAKLNRSFKLTVMRGSTAMQTAMMRYSDEIIRLPYALGYYLTGKDEVVPNDDTMLGTRHGYLSGQLFTYDESSQEFIIYSADANLCSLRLTAGIFDLSSATGVTSLDPLYSWLDLSNVTHLNLSKTKIETLDMTKFPNADTLIAEGDPASKYNSLKIINFGEDGEDDVCKLKVAKLSHNQLTDTIDLRNCQWMIDFIANDNKIGGIKLGVANTDQMLSLDKLDLENNQVREVDINNCGQIQVLKLAGNPIERLWLTVNSKGSGLNGVASKQWCGVRKNIECFTLSWATAAEAKGLRQINVEHYWWRVYSAANESSNVTLGYTPYEGGWVAANPLVKALADGVEVVCWTYHGEDGADSHPINGHTHVGGSAPCSY